MNQKLIWTILIWFALLQTLSPLIHAHVETDTPEQGHGFHVHVEDTIYSVPTLENRTKNLHTIGVEQAITEVFDLLPSPLFSVLLILFSLLGFKVFFKCTPSVASVLPFFARPRSRPRAPPSF